jgi:serine protease Do
VDADGRIVGINTFIVSRSGGNEGIGFAAPSNIVKTIYEQIRKYGRVRRGQVGVIAQTITPELAQALQLARPWGVLISDVVEHGAAEAADIQIKDIVLTLNGKPMENARQFGVNVYQRAGETITLEILRGKEKLTKQIAVLERPKDPDRITSLITGEHNIIPKLGVIGLDLDEKISALLPAVRRLSGVVVAGTIADSSSQDVILAGDVIYGINTTPVRNLSELKEAVKTLPPAQPVALQVERLGQIQYVTLDIE